MNNSFTDAPEHKDEFNIGSYIKGLSQFIRNCDTPLTLAIQGDWGSGKTSIMYQVEENLKKTSKIKTIFFNTWQYSQFEMGNELAILLLTDLINELGVFGEQRTEFFKIVGTIASKGLEYVNPDFGILNGEKIAEKVQNLSKLFSEQSNNIKDLKGKLQSIINQAVNRNRYEKIVIFIDDLDRLIPEKAVELLEVLKLFLDCENCIFVLAIDYNIVIRGTKSKYGGDLDDDKGKAFFEKIIQVPFTVPLANYDMHHFIGKSLERLGYNLKREQKDIVIQLIKNSIGNNPRSIKRLFNSVRLLQYIIDDREKKATKNKEKGNDQMLTVAMVCFQLRFEKAYNYILTSYNNSPEDSEDTERYLIDLLENAFELPEDSDYNFLVSFYGDFTMNNQADKSDFSKFYQSLKVLLGTDAELTLEQFEKLVEKMTLSNAVAIGNTDTTISTKKTQNHLPNEDVQYVMRKLFNHLVGKEHFELSKPEHFGQEDKASRDLPISSQFIAIANEYDRVRLTQGKGQGIRIYSSHKETNNIYTSGDTYGRLLNDGMMIFWRKKLVAKISKFRKANYLAKELRYNDDLFEEFIKEFEDELSNLLVKVQEHINYDQRG